MCAFWITLAETCTPAHVYVLSLLFLLPLTLLFLILLLCLCFLPSPALIPVLPSSPSPAHVATSSTAPEPVSSPSLAHVSAPASFPSPVLFSRFFSCSFLCFSFLSFFRRLFFPSSTLNAFFANGPLLFPVLLLLLLLLRSCPLFFFFLPVQKQKLS